MVSAKPLSFLKMNENNPLNFELLYALTDLRKTTMDSEFVLVLPEGTRDFRILQCLTQKT